MELAGSGANDANGALDCSPQCRTAAGAANKHTLTSLSSHQIGRNVSDKLYKASGDQAIRVPAEHHGASIFT